MKKFEIENCASLVKKLAIRAGEIMEKNRNKIIITKTKRDKLDIQTNIDLQVEKIFVDAILIKYPDHSIISEENSRPKNSDYVWYLDPLDGTKEYYRGISFYNISIMLEYKNKAILSIVYRPTDHELYCSYDGKSYLNESFCQVSAEEKIKKSTLYFYLPNRSMPEKLFGDVFTQYTKLCRAIYRMRGSSDENSFIAMAAAGKHEGLIDLCENHTSWWDIGPGIYILESAGGVATDRFGNNINSRVGLKHGLVATNGKIHEQILKIINNS